MAGKEIIMADKKYLIEINHVGKKFGDLTVLKDISIKVKEKEVVVIIGPSGSGKSTLLRCINGLEKPTSGNVFFDGMPVNGEKNINEVRTEVGMVFQRFNLFPHMTVIQNLMLAPMKVRKISKKEAYDRGMSLLRKVGLEDKADIDDAITEILVSTDEERRQELYTFVLTRLHEDAVYIPLTYECNKAIYRSDLQGFHFTQTQYEVPFADFYFGEKK